MSCCRKNSDDETTMEDLCKKEVSEKPFTWHPTFDNVQQIAHVRRLECQYEALQSSFVNLSTQLARLQFRVRQIISAKPCNREKLIEELERVVFKEISMPQNRSDKLPTTEAYNSCMGDIKKKQRLLINDLRVKIGRFPLPTDKAFENALDLGKENEKDDGNKSKPTKSQESIKPLSNKSSMISQKQSAISVKSSGSKSRKPGGSDVFSDNSSSAATKTQEAVTKETSERSPSFQELRDKYQNNSV